MGLSVSTACIRPLTRQGKSVARPLSGRAGCAKALRTQGQHHNPSRYPQPDPAPGPVASACACQHCQHQQMYWAAHLIMISRGAVVVCTRVLPCFLYHICSTESKMPTMAKCAHVQQTDCQSCSECKPGTLRHHEQMGLGPSLQQCCSRQTA